MASAAPEIPKTDETMNSSADDGAEDLTKAMESLSVSAADATPKPVETPSAGDSVPVPVAVEVMDEDLAPFIVRSSLDCPFIVLSSVPDFVTGVPAMPLKLFRQVVKSIEWCGATSQTTCSVLADFEGEAPGFGGELTVAQFLPTSCVHPERYDVVHQTGKPSVKGLLVNIQDPNGAALVKEIMANQHIAKVMWGTDGDVISLRYQHNLGVTAQNVVDVQLQHSSPPYRLGMARALQRVAGDRRLTAKHGQLNFSPRVYNKRILPFPISFKEALYSVDDLHRIELLTVQLGGRHVRDGKNKAQEFISRINDQSIAVESLYSELNYFNRRYGQPKAIKGVEILRGVIHVRQVFKDMKPELARKLNSVEQQVQRNIRHMHGVVIPTDLSFRE